MTRRRRTELEHQRLLAFAKATVNLSGVRERRYSRAVSRVWSRLAPVLAADSTYAFSQALVSGSMAKRTAIRSTRDIDLALYLRPARPLCHEFLLLEWLLARLQEAEADLAADQFVAQDHSVRILYHDGTRVDVVPIIAAPDSTGNGHLVHRQTGDRTLTNIPRHLEFTRVRDLRSGGHYRQVVRLVKWWARQRKEADPRFKFKPFLAELLCALLVDKGLDLSDYPEGLAEFFAYIVRSQLRDVVMFEDYHSRVEVPSRTQGPITVLDPANPADNVVASYVEKDRLGIIAAAESSLTALDNFIGAVSPGGADIVRQTLLGDELCA